VLIKALQIPPDNLATFEFDEDYLSHALIKYSDGHILRQCKSKPDLVRTKSLFCPSLIKDYLPQTAISKKTQRGIRHLRIYNLSKSSREALAENIAKIPGAPALKSKDLKIAEGDDPLYEIIFDSQPRIYLGFKKKKSKEDIGTDSEVFPLLKDEWLLPSRPTITVDSGAIKYVVGGANIMRPGITKTGGDFGTGEIVVVNEEKFGKAIAVGRANLNKKELEEAKKGAVVQNLHYAGDKFWEMLKEVLVTP